MSYVLRNAAGMNVRFVALGGIITHIEVPDRDGRFANVVINLPELDDYRRTSRIYCLGALVGRYAGRIAGARYDGHVLPANEGPNTLHGGDDGFDTRDWRVEQLDEATARLTLTSPDGDHGFPGRLEVAVTYALLPDNVLRIAYEATTDAPTVVNLTQHSYFNLGGEPDLSGHRLQLFASRRAAVDGWSIPTGDFPDVAGTMFDFREPRPIDAEFDNSWLLDNPGGLAARLSHPASGRVLEVETSEPTCHMYNATHFPPDGPLAPRSSIALETQHLPDSPNRPDFPSTRLLPGETFRSETRWRFLVV
jgi:aldose 1-epimerase